MGEIHRFIAVGAADVDVLAEYGELLREVAVEAGEVVETLGVVDAAIVPFLEWVRAPARDAEIEPARRGRDGFAHRPKFGEQPRVARLYRRAHLDHAFGDFGLDVSRAAAFRQCAEKIGGAAREVVVARVDDLQLELDAERERPRGLEGQLVHGISFSSPARAALPRRA